jgi:uncharacterized protein YciI
VTIEVPVGSATALNLRPTPQHTGIVVHYLLFYDVIPDYAERRLPFRAAHLEHARAAHARGELLLGGALADPVDGAVLLFQGDTPAIAESFAAADPYVANGLVTRWAVRTWTVVVGGDDPTP